MEDGVVWAGTEPGAIFRSSDRGESFELVRGLWDHPHRTEWGAGFGGQAFHTILPHPTDADVGARGHLHGRRLPDRRRRRVVGAAQQGREGGVPAEGQQYPEFGQCVHKVARHPADPERLFLQNHGGVYRSDDDGALLESIADGLPADFGFPIVVHPHEPDTVYVFPLNGGDGPLPARRQGPGLALARRRRHLGGARRRPAGRLLRRRDARRDVRRRPRAAGLYFGARNGAVWGSADEGETWRADGRGPPRRDGGPGGEGLSLTSELESPHY